MKKLVLSIVTIALLSVSITAQENTEEVKKWQARFRVISVISNESATIETIGGDVEISTEYVPELDFTYFFNENWSAELILATTKHDVNTKSSDLTPIEGPADADVDLGSVWLLPPTLTLQYHFATEGFRPYLGAGLNYTIFYGVDEGAVVDVKYDNTVGFAFQGGFDYDLNEKWFLNFDVKQILLSTDVKVDAGAAVVNADVDINPLVIGFGIGMKF